MDITYEWSVSQMKCYPQQDGNKNVVYNVHWVLSAYDNEFSYSIPGLSYIKYNQNNEFIQYEDLSQEDVIKWVSESLGEEKILNIKKYLFEIIHDKKNPSILTVGLPWIKEAA